jgi:thiamine transport system permease protein
MRPAGPLPLPLPALAAAGVVAALTLGPLAAVALRAGGAGAMGPADWAALRFTLWQAALSAVLSVALAVPVARALARRRFAGRALLIALLGAPFLLPTVVAVMGLLAVFGRRGLVNEGLAALGLPEVQIYGLQGVVLAHVFFNLPLAARLILHGWLAIPAERFRLAEALGFRPADIRRHLEWPMLRAVVPGALATVFLLCLSSFAVALILGGGPRATTVELAIYQAFRFDFDLPRAATLALVQLGLGLAALAAASRVALPAAFGPGLDRPVTRHDAGGAGARIADALAIGAAAVFLLVPLGMVVAAGVPRLAELPAPVWQAALRSLAVALAAAGIAGTLALALALGAARGTGRIALAGALPLALSPFVLGTGLFLIVFPLADPSAWALPVTALVNGMMALPFAVRALEPAARAAEADFGRLADSLGLSGAARLRWVTLPRIARPLAFSVGLAAALSAGDLGIVALFSGPETTTLPLEIFRLMGAYRMADAAAAALLLLALSLALFWAIDRGGRGHAAA